MAHERDHAAHLIIARPAAAHTWPAIGPLDLGLDEGVDLRITPPPHASKARRFRQTPTSQERFGCPPAHPKARRHVVQSQHLHTYILVHSLYANLHERKWLRAANTPLKHAAFARDQ